uniref:BTB domain-containing protein n=1 Tax=Panagrellus redivivus TaxID=6233 RepID=A0A7E4VIV6_PANRE
MSCFWQPDTMMAGKFLLRLSVMMLVPCTVQGFMVFVQKVYDSYTFTLDEALYYKSENIWFSTAVEGPKRVIPILESKTWHVVCYPFDNRNYDAVGVYLNVPGVMRVIATFSVVGTSHAMNFTHTFPKTDTVGIEKFILREEFLGLLVDGTVTIQCEVEFHIPYQYFRHDVFEISKYRVPDFELIVEDKRVKTHRYFLQLISPVFEELITNLTDLKPTGLKIDNFTFSTVKLAMEMAYGLSIYDLTVAKVIDVFQFAIEYDLKSLADKLEEALVDNIALDTFYTIVDFAGRNGKELLQQACAVFFKDNREQITQTREFSKINPVYMADLFRMSLAFDH